MLINTTSINRDDGGSQTLGGLGAQGLLSDLSFDLCYPIDLVRTYRVSAEPFEWRAEGFSESAPGVPQLSLKITAPSLEQVPADIHTLLSIFETTQPHTFDYFSLFIHSLLEKTTTLSAGVDIGVDLIGDGGFIPLSRSTLPSLRGSPCDPPLSQDGWKIGVPSNEELEDFLVEVASLPPLSPEARRALVNYLYGNHLAQHGDAEFFGLPKKVLDTLFGTKLGLRPLVVVALDGRDYNGVNAAGPRQTANLTSLILSTPGEIKRHLALPREFPLLLYRDGGDEMYAVFPATLQSILRASLLDPSLRTLAETKLVYTPAEARIVELEVGLKRYMKELIAEWEKPEGLATCSANSLEGFTTFVAQQLFALSKDLTPEQRSRLGVRSAAFVKEMSILEQQGKLERSSLEPVLKWILTAGALRTIASRIYAIRETTVEQKPFKESREGDVRAPISPARSGAFPLQLLELLTETLSLRTPEENSGGVGAQLTTPLSIYRELITEHSKPREEEVSDLYRSFLSLIQSFETAGKYIVKGEDASGVSAGSRALVASLRFFGKDNVLSKLLQWRFEQLTVRPENVLSQEAFRSFLSKLKIDRYFAADPVSARARLIELGLVMAELFSAGAVPQTIQESLRKYPPGGYDVMCGLIADGATPAQIREAMVETQNALTRFKSGDDPRGSSMFLLPFELQNLGYSNGEQQWPTMVKGLQARAQQLRTQRGHAEGPYAELRGLVASVTTRGLDTKFQTFRANKMYGPVALWFPVKPGGSIDILVVKVSPENFGAINAALTHDVANDLLAQAISEAWKYPCLPVLLGPDLHLLFPLGSPEESAAHTVAGRSYVEQFKGLYGRFPPERPLTPSLMPIYECISGAWATAEVMQQWIVKARADSIKVESRGAQRDAVRTAQSWTRTSEAFRRGNPVQNEQDLLAKLSSVALGRINVVPWILTVQGTQLVQELFRQPSS